MNIRSRNKDKARFLRSADFIVRCINDETIIDSWLMCGIADGDCESMNDEELVEYYNADMQEIISLFLRLMKRAGKDGLYVGGKVGTYE